MMRLRLLCGTLIISMLLTGGLVLADEPDASAVDRLKAAIKQFDARDYDAAYQTESYLTKTCSFSINDTSRLRERLSHEWGKPERTSAPEPLHSVPISRKRLGSYWSV